MPPDTDVDAMGDVWTVERRKEFRDVMDRDKDGKVTVDELEVTETRIFKMLSNFKKAIELYFSRKILYF